MAVLGLAHEVGRDQLGIRGVVGDHRDLRGAGEHVDADAAEQRALGFGDELVARPHDDVGRAPGEQAERHRRDRLHAAQRHHHVRPRLGHGVEHAGMDRLAAIRGGAGDHARHAGRTCAVAIDMIAEAMCA